MMWRAFMRRRGDLRIWRRAASGVSAATSCAFGRLSISPLKNAGKLNEIGERLGAEYGIRYLGSDFKKKNGYKRSVELSEEYGMYRQYYCGCVFSKRQRDAQITAKEQEQKNREE